jgi:5,6-dimethylbenzimidazole synthase
MNMWTEEFRESLHCLLRLRRDVRSFRTEPIPQGAMQRWIELACLAPSVGYCQPWRFVSVESPAKRASIAREFEAQNHLCLTNYDADTASEYARLKLAGLEEAPEHLAVFVQSIPAEGRGLGRATMPETVVYSVIAAIQNLWIVARAEGIGIGWVSILRPEIVSKVLEVPSDWELVAYLCIGYPVAVKDVTPALNRLGWEDKLEMDSLWLKR